MFKLKVSNFEETRLQTVGGCFLPESLISSPCIIVFNDYYFNAYPKAKLVETIGIPRAILSSLSIKVGSMLEFLIVKNLEVPTVDKIIIALEDDKHRIEVPDEEVVKDRIEIFKNLTNVYQYLNIETALGKFNYRVKQLFSNGNEVKYGILGEEFEMSFPAFYNSLLKVDKFDPVDLGIGGLEKEISEIIRIVFTSRLYSKDLQQSLHIKHVKGVLLYGPPGNGKTLIARHLSRVLNAVECNIVNGPEFFDRFVGEGEKKIRELFAKAKEDEFRNQENSGLHVIIFDEFDAVAKKRGMDTSGNHTDTLVNQLLACIDGVESLNNILIFAMTNRKDMIDPALLRPGRIEVHIEINLPSHEGRVQILKIHSKHAMEAGLLDNIDFDDIARRTKNFSGAELEATVSRALKEAMYSNVDQLTLKCNDENFKVLQEHFYRAITTIKPMFGVDESLLSAVPLSHISDNFEAKFNNLKSLIQLGETMNQYSLLVYGKSGSGKSAMVDYASANSNFSYIKKIGPGNLAGMTKQAKVFMIYESFENALRSEKSMIILEDIEYLIEFVYYNKYFNHAIHSEIVALLKKKVPSGRKLMIIGTTSNLEWMKSLGLHFLFQEKFEVPDITTEEEMKNALSTVGIEMDLNPLIKNALPVPLKKLIVSALSSKSSDENSKINIEKFKQSLGNN